MNTSAQASIASPHPPGAVVEPRLVDRLRSSKALIPTMAVMGVTVLALAAALVVNKSDAQPGGSAGYTATAANTPPKTPPKDAPPVVRSPATALQRAPVLAQGSPKLQAPRAESCATCGTVESAVAVERQGKVNGVAVGNTTIGIGTVAGGVLGGVLGNQVGGGNGKTAMTVLGAAGGAYAGNTVEKNMKKVTVYQMRVRMNNGSVRTIEQASPVAAGSSVVVQGNSLRLAQ